MANQELVNYFENGITINKPTPQEKIEMCFHHMDYLSRIKPEKVCVLEMRSHIAWYLKGLNNSIEIKKKVFQTTTIKELKEILENYLNNYET